MNDQNSPQALGTAPQQTQSVSPTPALIKKTVKKGYAVTLIVFASINLLISIATLPQSSLVGLIMASLSVYWLVAGVRSLKMDDAKAYKSLQTAGSLVLAWAGILIIGGLFLPGIQIGAAVLPLLFGISFGVLSGILKKQLRS